MFRDYDSWGNDALSPHNLKELLDYVDNDICIRLLPFFKDVNNEVSVPLFELTDRPTDDAIENMENLHDGYEINIYENTVTNSEYKYLLIIHLLRYHVKLHNSESMYSVHDSYSGDMRVATFPFNSLEGNKNRMEMDEALNASHEYAKFLNEKNRNGLRPASDRDKIQRVTDEIKLLEEEFSGNAPLNVLLSNMSEKYNVGVKKTEQIIRNLVQKGVIYEPTNGYFRRVV